MSFREACVDAEKASVQEEANGIIVVGVDTWSLL